MAVPGRFGRYRLDEEIGHGGMGQVYRAFDMATNRAVAIKRLKPDVADDPEFEARFRREAGIAAGLEAPHIVPVYDYGEIGGRFFIAMRLVNGTDLGELIARSGPLPPGRAVEIISQIAQALTAAHRKGVIHRDLKPSNVLVETIDDESGRGGNWGTDDAYLADFGIARAVGSTRFTEMGAVGTPPYIAPERIKSPMDSDDHLADIYALGCVLYETLTGNTPFTGDKNAQAYAHLRTPPPAPSKQRPELPPRFDDVVAKALAKDPLLRYQSAATLAAAARASLGVERQAQHLAATKLRPSTDPARDQIRAEFNVDHHLGTVALSPDGIRLATATESLAEVRDVATGLKLASIPHGHAEVSKVALSRDGLLATACVAVTYWADAYIWDDHLRAGELWVSDKDILMWSYNERIDDSRIVEDARIVKNALIKEQQNFEFVAKMALEPSLKERLQNQRSHYPWVRVWDAASGHAVAMMTPAARVEAVAFSAEGNRLATGSDNGTATVWDPAAGKELRTVTHGELASVSVSAVAFSTEGNLLVTAGSDRAIRVWDLVSGQEQARMTHGGVRAVAFSADDNRLATGSADLTARVWELSTGQELARMTHPDRVGQVLFSPDGTWLATATDDGKVRMWHVAQAREMTRSAPEPTARVTGRRIWAAVTDRLNRSSKVEEPNPVVMVAFGADGLVATISRNGTARVSSISWPA